MKHSSGMVRILEGYISIHTWELNLESNKISSFDLQKSLALNNSLSSLNICFMSEYWKYTMYPPNLLLFRQGKLWTPCFIYILIVVYLINCNVILSTPPSYGYEHGTITIMNSLFTRRRRNKSSKNRDYLRLVFLRNIFSFLGLLEYTIKKGLYK